eukprot:TRINITY_DN4308_c0_g1_i8.p1 TRINITY_DN4308_c0_g1~~TRINITY_DN4308_c0_g1_i8.p1  ORF type:complete len:301 (+),score=33.36 TRINITY_DN4308_c0_g1_i8:633-1535(+)
MPCFKCTNSVCEFSGAKNQSSILGCSKCNQFSMILKKVKNNRLMLSCMFYPNCKNTAFLPDCIIHGSPTIINCPLCQQNQIKSYLVELQFYNQESLPISMKTQINVEESSLFCLNPGCNKDLCDMGYRFIKELSTINSNSNHQPQKQNTANFVQKNAQGNNNKNNKSGKNGVNSNGINVQQQQSSNYLQNIVCFKCQQPGNYASNCPQKAQQNENLNLQNKEHKAQTTDFSNIVCYACNQRGHFANNCPNKNQKGNQNEKKRTAMQGQQQQKKVCKVCGVQGKHPKGSTCAQVCKKKGKI